MNESRRRHERHCGRPRGQRADGKRVILGVGRELFAVPDLKKEDLDAFVADAKILVDWHISECCWIVAGIAFAVYARRRNRQKITSPRRILADFIIGAHAAEVGGLLTADVAFYRANFPEPRDRA